MRLLKIEVEEDWLWVFEGSFRDGIRLRKVVMRKKVVLMEEVIGIEG